MRRLDGDRSFNRINYGLDEQKAATETFIRRWRLEPSDPEAYARGEVVDPVKPITYYVDPATPERYVGAVSRGIENWQAAFESAGFSNAIVALEAPTKEEDPDWDPEDVRYSVARWSASQTRNAQGPSTSDPRTGEIIESDIVWYHNHMRSYRNWMMVQTGAANPDARQLPLTNALMEEAMEQVITHEIGHAIGLPHNMVASSSYPVDSPRSQTFSSRMGVAPTIMDYARQNYMADTLDRWIVERADDRMYKYLPQGGLGVSDPRAQTEDMGDDPVRASEYGMANLRRIVPRLVEWTTKPGEDYSDLNEIYGEALGQWSRYVGHVATLVAGVHVDLKTSDQDGPVFDGIPRADQKRAMDWLAREVFNRAGLAKRARDPQPRRSERQRCKHFEAPGLHSEPPADPGADGDPGGAGGLAARRRLPLGGIPRRPARRSLAGSERGLGHRKLSSVATAGLP